MTNADGPRNWWQTVPGIITATAGLVTAIGGLVTILMQARIIGPDKPSSPSAQTPDTTPAPRSISQPPTGNRSRPAAADLEGGLERANIQLSTGTAGDIARVRGYMSDPDGPYALLADACLDVLAGRRLKQRGHLDMIDKWYTLAVGQGGYLSGAGTIRLEELKDAMVKATNEIHGTAASSFDEIVEAIR